MERLRMDSPMVWALPFIFSQFMVSATHGVCSPGCHPENGFCESPGECRCHPGWRGRSCDQCVPFPGCLHGRCSEPWQCVCEDGWIGSHCNIDIHPCAAYPCSSNSTCIETGDGGYICLCAPGFTGKNCLVKIGPCITNGSPCQNGGTCMDNNGFSGHASCRCLEGFAGDYCELDKDDCSPNPCANGGTCADTGPSFHCHCPAGFGGRSCSERLSWCNSNPCTNGGTCYEKPDRFQCSCPPQYSGATCAFPTKRNNKPSYNLPPHHKGLQHPAHEVLKIIMKETIHKSELLISRSEIICFIILGFIVCLIILISIGIVFISKCKTWFANAKYRHLIHKEKDFCVKASRETGNELKIIFPEKVKMANYSRSYTTI
ncbi:unnamed protein product [Staurois parvus]|uniref:EGF-like domain-containing protein n=1 Tax=Staurois parvus TaxID=386267 RepID=A0ABN9EEI6_9NEOB|nr:unnamed protein product [Staurois parvus]